MAATASLPAYMLPGVPVHQPSHLDGDAKLATEILPGPPSLLSAQQSAQRRDPRKPSTAYSYLPPSDPGSTYSGIMHGTLIGQELDGPLTKRSRVDRGPSSRAQRASARNQLSNPERIAQSEVTMTPTPPIMAEGDLSFLAGSEQRLSRAASSHEMLDGTTSVATRGKSRRKDKGKAREVEPLVVKVKEEPKAISLHSPEPLSMVNNNEDHCSSCRSQGILVYCDGCPRAFHLLCLDPPLDKIDDGDSRWYCPLCITRRQPPRKPPPSLLSPLIYQVDMSIPAEFQLPDDIRNFYKDVATGPRGTYIDASELKQPRLNRHGQVEDRDAYRLRDRNGAPILCYRCGTSALPDGLVAATHTTKRARKSPPRTDAWKSVISCDYCSLHWHLDCLEPPLSSMPPLSRKWMCPNHAEQVMPTKRRVPKQNGGPIEITELNQFNNGNIEVIYPEAAPNIQHAARISTDEVLINGRRYRVPEKVILLDFWSQLHRDDIQKDKELVSLLSSPLTSLSSLDEPEERLSQDLARYPAKPEEMQVAQMLLGLKLCKRGGMQSTFPSSVNIQGKQLVDRAMQTVPEQQQPVVASTRITKATKPIAKRSSLQAPPNLNGVAKVPTQPSVNSASLAAPTPLKRRKSTQMQAESSTRELRSRKAVAAVDSSLTSISSKGSLNETASALPLPSQSFNRKGVHVKLEEQDADLSLRNDLSDVESTPLSSTAKVLPRRGRAARRATQKESGEGKNHGKERRGRKRKEREEETQEHRLGDVCKVQAAVSEIAERERKDKDRTEKEKKKGTRTPTQHGSSTTVAHIPPAQPVAASSAPATPSLKIRLPRLTQLNGLHATSSSG